MDARGTRCRVGRVLGTMAALVLLLGVLSHLPTGAGDRPTTADLVEAVITEESLRRPTGGRASAVDLRKKLSISLRPGAWATLMSQQNAMLDVMHGAAKHGIDATGSYAFMDRELPAQIENWRKQYER